VTPSGIEPVTFRFVAQHLNHCATVVSLCPHDSDFFSDTFQLHFYKSREDTCSQQDGATAYVARNWN